MDEENLYVNSAKDLAAMQDLAASIGRPIITSSQRDLTLETEIEIADLSDEDENNIMMGTAELLEFLRRTDDGNPVFKIRAREEQGLDYRTIIARELKAVVIKVNEMGGRVISRVINNYADTGSIKKIFYTPTTDNGKITIRFI